MVGAPAHHRLADAVVGQRFRQAMGGFHEEMKVRAAALDAEQEETKGLLRKLAAFFGEDPNQANPDAIMRACAERPCVARRRGCISRVAGKRRVGG